MKTDTMDMEVKARVPLTLKRKVQARVTREKREGKATSEGDVVRAALVAFLNKSEAA